MPNAWARSTSWGSLVRAQYRPSRDPLETAGFFFSSRCRNRFAFGHRRAIRPCRRLYWRGHNAGVSATTRTYARPIASRAP